MNDHSRKIKTPHSTTDTSQPTTKPPSDDILTEIRNDYHQTNKRLKKYNRFIDRSPATMDIITAILVLAVLIGFPFGASLMENKSAIGIMLFSISGIILVALITLSVVRATRKASVREINAKLKSLEKEVASYQYVTKHGLIEQGMSRDELGLFQDSLYEHDEKGSSSGRHSDSGQSTGLTALGYIAILFWMIGGLAGANSPIMATIALISCIVSLIVAIALMASSNRGNKTSGGTMITFWIILLIISLFVIHGRIQSAEQQQQIYNTPSYHVCGQPGVMYYCSN